MHLLIVLKSHCKKQTLFTVETASEFASSYRFLVLNSLCYCCKLSDYLFFFIHRFMVFLMRNIEFVHRFIVVKKYIFFLSFYCCKSILLSLQKYHVIVAFYRLIVVRINVETILTIITRSINTGDKYVFHSFPERQ